MLAGVARTGHQCTMIRYANDDRKSAAFVDGSFRSPLDS